MKKIYISSFFIAFFGVLSLGSHAQDSLNKAHLILKIAPLTMFDIDNTFEFAAEHRLGQSKRWTLSEQLGYGAGVANLWGENNDFGPAREHYRVKVEVRRYDKKASNMAGGYLAYELFYKQVNDELNRSVGRECDGGPCAYFETLDYPVSKYVVGATIKVGYQARLRNEDKKKTKFVFDFYVGLGVRRIMIDHKIDGAATQNNSWFGNDGFFPFGSFGYADRAYNIPHGSLGIRLGYLVF
ncbi:hypothetical protein GCM10027035_28290 [Emticicia sediminis]